MKKIFFAFGFAIISSGAVAENSFTPMRDCDTTLWLIDEVIRVNAAFNLTDWEAIDAGIIERHPDTNPTVALRSKNIVDGILTDIGKQGLTPDGLKAQLRKEWHC